jgi:hypothetical protein
LIYFKPIEQAVSTMHNFIYIKQLSRGVFAYILSDTPPRLALQQYPDYELYRTFNDAQTARSCYTSLVGEKQSLVVVKKKRKPWRMTRARKKALKNFVGHPIDVATRRKISEKNKGLGLGGKFSATRKTAISAGLRKHYWARPRRRCVDLDGNEHLVDWDFVLPEGWCYGRPRGKGGGRPLGVGNIKGKKRVYRSGPHIPFPE